MAEFIKIDTKYAKRDITRMQSAATALDDAAKKYSDLCGHIAGVYKGEAANELINVLDIEMKKCSINARQLRTAAKKLQNTITQYEDYNRKIINQIKGK